MQVRIRLKKDTLANWETNNPILLDGELIYVVMDDGSIQEKVGDGINAFSDLPYHEQKKVVKYSPDILTEDEQMQARANLGLYRTETALLGEASLTLTNGEGYANVRLAAGGIRVVMLRNDGIEYVLSGTANYIGAPVDDYRFIAQDENAKVTAEYTMGDWRVFCDGQSATAFDGAYTVTVYSDTIKTIPEEYIPDTIARVEDVAVKLAEKIDVNQGAENAGKVMTVGEDGVIINEYPVWNDYTKLPGYSLMNNYMHMITLDLTTDLSWLKLGLYGNPSYIESSLKPGAAALIEGQITGFHFKDGDTSIYQTARSYDFFEVIENNDKIIKIVCSYIYAYAQYTYIFDKVNKTATEKQTNYTKNQIDNLLEEKLPQPSSATIGQLIAVQGVDESGKVSATEGIDVSADAAMELSAEMGLIDPTVNENGAVYTDENGLVYIL